MKKFNYRMQSILNIKEKMEEQEKTNYGAARAKLLAEEERLNNMKLKKEGYEEELKGNVSETLHIEDIKRCTNAIETMKYLISQQKIQVKKSEQAVELARQKLTFAMREHKMHEILREKAFESYVEEMNSEERKEIDENISFKYGEKQKQTEGIV